MFEKTSFFGVERREQAILDVMEFLHTDGEALRGAALAAGGAKVHEECLQLFCDIVGAERLTRSIRADLERLQAVLAEAAFDVLGRDHCMDQHSEDIRLTAARLANLLNRIAGAEPTGGNFRTLLP